MAAVSQRKYAEHRGVTHGAVQKAIKTGRISTDANGKIDPVKADRQWDANTDITKPLNSVVGNPKHRALADGAKQPVRPRPRPQAAESGGGDGGGGAPAAGQDGGSNYLQARAIREHYAARLAKLEYDEKIGKVIAADQVKLAIFKVITESKTRIMAIKSQAKSELPHLSQKDLDTIERLLLGAMRELSEWTP